MVKPLTLLEILNQYNSLCNDGEEKKDFVELLSAVLYREYFNKNLKSKTEGNIRDLYNKINNFYKNYLNEKTKYKIKSEIKKEIKDNNYDISKIKNLSSNLLEGKLYYPINSDLSRKKKEYLRGEIRFIKNIFEKN